MNILAFDTATQACTVALLVKDEVYARHQIAPREHANLLLLEIQALCNEAGIVPAELQAIAFGAGPGSFMGVRLAAAVAQGLGFGLSLPLMPISTLQTLAQTVFEESAARRLLVGWDARMDEIYWGLYAVDEKGIALPVLADRLSAPNAIEVDAQGFVLAGNAWSVYQARLPENLLSVKNRFVDLYPKASAMLTIAKHRFVEKDFVSADTAMPHYLRAFKIARR